MATVSKWTPFGVALNITAIGGTVTRKSATQYTVKINASWETYWNGAQTNYGMSVSSGGSSIILNTFGNKTSGGNGSFTGTYTIDGNGSATKTITVTFKNYEEDWQGNVTESATKTVNFSVFVPAWVTYTVKYNANGGSGAPSSQMKWKDQTLKLSSAKPIRTGYTFQGWATSPSGSVIYGSGANYTANASVTLYAIWKVVTYTVKYNANGGFGAPSSQMKVHGTTITLSNTIPTRTAVEDDGTIIRYVFKGWATSSASTSVAYNAGANYTTNASVVLYAVWRKVVSVDSYDVFYNSNGGSEVVSQIKIKGTSLKLRNTIPIRSGYTFAGWGLSSDSTVASYNVGDYYNSDKDVVLYAIWTPWTHAVVFNANGGTGEVPNSFVATTDVDAHIIPDCTLTKKGCVFKYWSTQPSGSEGTNYYAGDGYLSLKNSGTITLYAIWDITNIYLYYNGECSAGEFIEDDTMSFNNDGTVHYVQFIENGSSIGLTNTAFYASELLERVVVYLTDEADTYLTDESENYLTSIM